MPLEHAQFAKIQEDITSIQRIYALNANGRPTIGEICLIDGRFATIKAPTLLDMDFLKKIPDSAVADVAMLRLCAIVDDEFLSYSSAMNISFVDYKKFLRLIVSHLE